MSNAVSNVVSDGVNNASPSRPVPSLCTYSLRSWYFRGCEIPAVEVELPAASR